MTVTPEDAYQLHDIIELQKEPPSPHRDARLVEMTARADDLGLRHAAFIARASEATAALQASDVDRMARALAWLDQHYLEERASLHPTIGVYVAGAYSKALDLTLGMIDVPYALNRGLVDTLRAWCRRLAYGERMADYYAFTLACLAGEDDEALDHLRRWRSQPYDDALARVDWAEDAVGWLGERGRPDEAVGLYDDVLSGDPAHKQRVELAAAALAPLETLGRGRDAARLFDHYARDPQLATPRPLAACLPWLARTGRLDEGLDLLAGTVVLLEPESGVADSRWLLGLARSAVVLLARAVADGRGDAVLRMRLPDEESLDEEVRAYLVERSRPITDVLAAFRARAETVADHIDTVNASTVARTDLHRYWAHHGLDVSSLPC